MTSEICIMLTSHAFFCIFLICDKEGGKRILSKLMERGQSVRDGVRKKYSCQNCCGIQHLFLEVLDF